MYLKGGKLNWVFTCDLGYWLYVASYKACTVVVIQLIKGTV